jgi:hypothetical protein
MDPAHRQAHCRLWTDVLRGAALDFVPAPASLLAFTAWQSGNGALAAMAVDRALVADPGYSMAQLLAGAVEAALPPSAARMPMSPAAVAASYAPTPGEAGSRTSPLPRADGSRPTASSMRRAAPARRRGRRRRPGTGRRRSGGAPRGARVRSAPSDVGPG